MELFTLFGRIAINNSGAISAIEDTSGRANKLSEVFSKLGHAVVGVGKVMAAGLAAGAAGVAALATNSVKQYAEYEQLVGGVETLFKESGNIVMQYANNAYKSAGLSANEYMSTVTSFSASLLQSLKGDTEAAAKAADMALTDMADNANKMGTSMEMIQNAYQGFSKQNYTMLDNLKLGYGGTQKEMQRLLKDAQKLSGVKYDITNLNDVYEAIHVIQTEMGITGTTALEASETISGSWASMSSAWTNLVVGIADDSQDLNKLIDNFADSAIVAFQNIAQRVPSIVQGISQLIAGIAPELSSMIQELLPYVVDGAVSLISGLAKVFPDLLQTLFDMLPGILQKVGQAISDIWTGTVWPAIQDLFMAVFGVELPDWDTLVANIANGWNGTVWPAIQNFFKQNFNIDLPSWAILVSNISDGWNNVVLPGITGFFKTIFHIELPSWAVVATTISTAWNNIVLPAIVNLFRVVFNVSTEDTTGVGVGKRIRDWWDKALEFIGDIFRNIFMIDTEDSDGSSVADRIEKWWDSALAIIGDIFKGFFRIEYDSEATLGERITAWWKGVLNFVGDIFHTIFSVLMPDAEGVKQAITNWWNTLKAGLNLTVTAKANVHYSSSGTAHGGASGDNWDSGGGTYESQIDAVSSPTINKLLKETSGVQMNAKGAIFDTATFFATNKGIQGVGEAGAEAVTPISVLRQYVREEVEAVSGASAKQMQEMNDNFRQFAEDLPDMLVNAFASMKFDVNNRELARMVKAVN